MEEYIVRTIRTRKLWGSRREKYASLVHKDKTTWVKGDWAKKIPNSCRDKLVLDDNGYSDEPHSFLRTTKRQAMIVERRKQEKSLKNWFEIEKKLKSGKPYLCYDGSIMFNIDELSMIRTMIRSTKGKIKRLKGFIKETKRRI